MWYVVQVCNGIEENIRLQCQKKISVNILEDCFIPYYEEKNAFGVSGVFKKRGYFQSIYL